MPHEDDGTIEVHFARQHLTDFEAVVLLGNPWPKAKGDWDYGLIFRHPERNHFHAVVVTSDARWSHRLRQGPGSDTILASGRIDTHWDLNAADYSFLQLRLVVKGDTGWVYVNGHPDIATLDLSTGPASGDVGVVSGFFSGNEIEGEHTPFNEFIIYDISQPAPVP